MTDEITQALTGKGWTVAPEAQADALVVLHGEPETKRSLNTFYSGMGGGYGYRGWGGMGGTGTATTTESEYTIGTLVVDIFDANSRACSGAAPPGVSSPSDKTEKNIKKLGRRATSSSFRPRTSPRAARRSK